MVVCDRCADPQEWGRALVEVTILMNLHNRRYMSAMGATYSGNGRLVIGAVEHPCQYHLEMRSIGDLQMGSGFVTAGAGVLWSAFVASKVVVQMKCGRSFPAIITSYGPGQPDAPFRLAGRIYEA